VGREVYGPSVYREGVVIDGSVSAPPSSSYALDLQRAGLTVANWTVSGGYEETVGALQRINEFHWLLEQFPEQTLLIEKIADITRAKREGKLGIMLAFQGAGPLGRNVHLIRTFHRLGIRMIALTYNEGNAYASGCTEPSDGGLTSLGIQAVQEMNRIGVIVDLSHVGERSSLEAIEVSEDPVVFSHSNPAALQANPRNLSDSQMRACAAKGGVIGLAVFSAFVGETRGGRRPGLDEYLRHMDYLLDLVGPNHVGVGTDIMVDHTDGVWWRAVTKRLYPEVTQGMTFETHNILGFEHQLEFPAVAQVMLDRGYQEETVRKLIGGNWLRVFGRVWDEGRGSAP
jgi:membrane dipeptidase